MLGNTAENHHAAAATAVVAVQQFSFCAFPSFLHRLPPLPYCGLTKSELLSDETIF